MKRSVTYIPLRINLKEGILELPEKVLKKLKEKSSLKYSEPVKEGIIMRNGYLSHDHLILPISDVDVFQVTDISKDSEITEEITEEVYISLRFKKGEKCTMKDFNNGYFMFNGDIFYRSRATTYGIKVDDRTNFIDYCRDESSKMYYEIKRNKKDVMSKIEVIRLYKI